MTMASAETKITPDILHYHQLLSALCQRDAKKIHQNIKVCILYEPHQKKYRNILD
jgi:hypothetical protein